MGLFTKFLKPKEEKPFKVGFKNSRGSAGAKLNVNSETWLYIAEWAKEELSILRRRNDNTALSIVKTAKIRGRIKQLKLLLELDKNK